MRPEGGALSARLDVAHLPSRPSCRVDAQGLRWHRATRSVFACNTSRRSYATIQLYEHAAITRNCLLCCQESACRSTYRRNLDRVLCSVWAQPRAEVVEH